MKEHQRIAAEAEKEWREKIDPSYGPDSMRKDMELYREAEIENAKRELKKVQEEGDTEWVGIWVEMLKAAEDASPEETLGSFLNNLCLDLPYSPRRFPVGDVRQHLHEMPEGEPQDRKQGDIDTVLAEWSGNARERLMELWNRHQHLSSEESFEFNDLLSDLYVEMRRRGYSHRELTA